MALYRRKISFMKSTLPARLPCGPNAFSNKQQSSSSEIIGWTICQYFLNSSKLTFAIDKALFIWKWRLAPWLSDHLCFDAQRHRYRNVASFPWLLNINQWCLRVWRIVPSHNLCLFHNLDTDGVMTTTKCVWVREPNEIWSLMKMYWCKMGVSGLQVETILVSLELVGRPFGWNLYWLSQAAYN